MTVFIQLFNSFYWAPSTVNPKGNQSWNTHWKNWYWSWSSNTLATWCKELTHWKRPWHWARLKMGGEVDDRGWDGWMASLMRWTWVWASCRSWWWTGKPGVLQSMGSQSQTRLRDWTELSTVCWVLCWALGIKRCLREAHSFIR